MNTHSEELLLFIDGLCRILYVSPSVQLLGYSANELTGKNVRELIAEKYLEQLKALIEGNTGQRKLDNLEVDLLDSRGGTICHVGSFADHTDDDAIGCHVLLLRRASNPPQSADRHTANGHAPSTTAGNSSGVQRTIANLGEGFFTLDHDSRFIVCNPITERLARLPREQILGRSIWDVFPVGQDHPLYKLLSNVIVNKIADSSSIYSITYNSWFTISAFPHSKGISVIHNDLNNGLKKNEDLIMANERYRRATQVTDEAHWDWDPLTNDVQWGNGFMQQFGYDANAMDGNIELLYQLIHPDDIQPLIESLQHAFQDPTLVVWEDRFRMKRASGEYVLVRSRGSVIRDANNTPIRVVGSLRDISKEHEATLKRDLLHRITHALNASIEMEDGLDQVLELICGHTKYKVGEIWLLDELEQTLSLGGTYAVEERLRPFIDEFHTKQLYPGEGLPGVAWLQKECIHWKALGEHPEFRRREFARSLGILEGLAFPVFNGDDKVLAIITLYADRPMHFHEGDNELLGSIAMQIAPEVKKRRAENELKNFFSLTKDLLCIVDVRGTVSKCNPAFKTELGWKEDEILGRHFLDLVHPEDLAAATEKRLEINEEDHVPYYENRIRCADGSYRWFAWTTTALNSNGTIYCTGKDITGKKQDESRLFDITQRMFDFKESITDALLMLDPDWTITYVNHECQKLLRRSYGELMDRTIWEMFPEAVGSDFERYYREAQSSGKAVHFESYFPPLGGWYEVHAYPSMTGLSVFFRDITRNHMLNSFLEIERQALAQNMSRSQPLALILDELILDVEKLVPGMHCALLTVDPNGKTLSPRSAPSLPDLYLKKTRNFPIKEGEGSLGTAAARMSSVIVKDILTDPLWENYRTEAAPFGLRACWSHPVISSSGQLLAVLAHYYGEPREPGPIEVLLSERLIHTLTVLLESHITEEAIRRSNERYELVSKATNDATWDWDVNTNVLVWGERVKDLFGIDPNSEPADLISWTSRIHPDDKEAALQNIHAVLMDEKAVKWEHEYRFFRNDGSIAYVFDRGYVIRDLKGCAIRMVGAMQDMTDRKEKELALHELNHQFAQRTQELEISNAELERFAYMVSHDLQEPLRMINSFMQLLEKKCGAQLDDKAREYITFAVNGSERMKSLIRDLLAYSRVNIDQQDRSDVDMSVLVHQVQNMFMQEIDTSGAVIECEGLPVIAANRTHMLQLLQNLLGNALKYRSEDPPRIRFTAYENEGHWEFRVSDNGVGVDEHNLEKIFIIFHRLHASREQNGTGIGLAICKKIVEKHQGRIWMTSLPGQGSTIHFTIAKDPSPVDKMLAIG